METKYFIFLCYTILLSSILSVEPFEDMKQYMYVCMYV